MPKPSKLAVFLPTGFSYKNLLPNTLIPNSIEYLFWEWTNDSCSERRISPDGNFSNLTIYGTDAVNNANYGILNKAVRDGVGAFLNLKEKNLVL